MLPLLLSAAAALCVLGWRCRCTHSLVTVKSPWKTVVRRWGRDADRDRSSPQRVPHRVSVCGAPMFSGRPLSIQGSAVHREGLTNVCFAECSDGLVQLMVRASEMWKLEGDSRSPLYRMGEMRLGKEADLCGQLRLMHLGSLGYSMELAWVISSRLSIHWLHQTVARVCSWGSFWTFGHLGRIICLWCSQETPGKDWGGDVCIRRPWASEGAGGPYSVHYIYLRTRLGIQSSLSIKHRL